MTNIPDTFKRFNAATLELIEALGGDVQIRRDRIIEFKRIERGGRA